MSICIFCDLIKPEQIIARSEHFFVVYDINPIQQGHLLIISNEHFMNITELSPEILLDFVLLEQRLTAAIENNFDVKGVTIFQNNGRTMDKGTHFHAHVVPRYEQDGFWKNLHIEQKPMDLEKLSSLVG